MFKIIPNKKEIGAEIISGGTTSTDENGRKENLI